MWPSFLFFLVRLFLECVCGILPVSINMDRRYIIASFVLSLLFSFYFGFWWRVISSEP